ncbi:putative RPA12-13.7 kD subunit of DNA-directed RNA polymerase I [Gigaspora margarita]|uniref:DNA-directed RNA polymerase I subunit RPA12 n=1 Tax=Gigaspora margarita TaxID=4874 RepID=A0A8H4A0N8_GIGMA|nr:putative RPA12-13.7 kD subunit of DNA-directed RNA polymerase I [Gigaspora margarita]
MQIDLSLLVIFFSKMSSKLSKSLGSIFCQDCGTLLINTGEDFIKCSACTCRHNATEYEDIIITTKSKPKTFPSKLRSRHSKIQQLDNYKEESASIKEKCPKCGNEEMSYHTMQLRSADEGQTIFYHCIKCGYKFSINS